MANLCYFCIRSSFASYLRFNFPMMRLESLLIIKLLMPRSLASLKLVSIASYSTLLFVVGNWSCTPHLRTTLSRDIMMTPMPPNSFTDDPSVWTVQSYIWSSPKKVNSTIKSSNTWASIANRCLYSMSNWLSSIAHCTRCLATFGLFMSFFIGWSVIKMIGCAWTMVLCFYTLEGLACVIYRPLNPAFFLDQSWAHCYLVTTRYKKNDLSFY